jgi:tRNA(fMet)-specific endonuclease VapC
MNLLPDTNILIYLSKNSQLVSSKIAINTNTDKVYISVVVLAELRSISLQNNWSQARWKVVKEYLDTSTLLEVNEDLKDTYTQIDSYSQRRNSSFQSYPFNTPRNMGKNDLWIAATASLLNLTLVTTDADFDHLHNVFINIKYIPPTELAT